MKKLFALLLILLMTAVWVSALDIVTEDMLNRLDLTRDQIQQVLQIQKTYQKQIKEAALEMNVYKAQLEKILFDEDPDMNKVKKLLEESLKWRLQSELAAIQERVQTRKILGEEKWEEMLRLRKRLIERRQMQAQTQIQPRPSGMEPRSLPGANKPGPGK